jgi:hypothetical protein
MKKIVWFSALLSSFLAMGLITENISFARVTDSADDRDAFCAGPSGAEACIDSSGDVIPTTDDDADLGTSSLQWQDGYFDGIVYADAISNDGAYTGTSGMFSGQVGIGSASSTTIATLVPSQVGAQIYNTTRYAICVGTAATAGSWIFQSSNPITTAGVSCKE